MPIMNAYMYAYPQPRVVRCLQSVFTLWGMCSWVCMWFFLFNLCVNRTPSRRWGVHDEADCRTDRRGIRNPRSACILLNHCTAGACLQRRAGERGREWREKTVYRREEEEIRTGLTKTDEREQISKGERINPDIHSIDNNAGIGIGLILVIGSMLCFYPLSSVCLSLNCIKLIIDKCHMYFIYSL